MAMLQEKSSLTVLERNVLLVIDEIKWLQPCTPTGLDSLSHLVHFGAKGPKI